jgi:flagellar basal body-associated protein FliL
MKRIVAPGAKGLLIVYRIIVAVILALVVVLIAGSLYAVFRSPDSGPLFQIGSGAGGPVSGGAGNAGRGAADGAANVSVFNGIGRLRIPAAGQPPATIILSIAFPYPSQDRAFTEELASRIGEFRSIAGDYFSSLPEEQLVSLDEDAAKAEILRRYNALLRLGTIDALYFNDLMIVD